ncbi:ABC transporter substrate-binding protein [Lederbergia citri]|uniref:Sugar ABC transporter substrate-binding protein n=1 Tax=Lederbergia citri TaxID=2833580 RepID=A0A942TDB5_9BACI|nr:sugar ABC transporter substrate-binding protein [Lederbergia citri]MBS4195608.1 sugar ABC transporter substrate-binding protein [Lederbergia citri]
MKSRLALFLVTIMIFSLVLTGCASKDSSTDGGKDGVVTLKFMGWEASPLETESVKKGIQKFEQDHPNIKVEYTPVPGDQYASKLLTMMAGDAPPDVFFLGSADYRSFQKRGVLLDLTTYFENDLSIDDFIPSSAGIMQINGSVYGVSSCTVSPVLYYNKNIFDEAGVPYPPSDPSKAWTWEEFEEAANKLTKKEGDKVSQFGAYGFENFANTVMAVMENSGVIFNDDYSETKINSNETKKVLESILSLKKNGLSPEAKLLEESGMSASQMLQTGKIAMLVDGSWALQELSKMDFPVGVAALPKFEKAVTTGQAHVHSAAAKTKHPEEAWEFIRFLSSEEYQIDLISEGLWMPNRVSLYSEDGITRWFNESVHPDGFKELVPYFQDATVDPFAINEKIEVRDIMVEELDKFWYDGQPADSVLTSIEDRVNKELAK